jgi:transcriptional regulator GlxA family with amidase domain
MGRRDGIGTVPPAPKPRRVVLLAMPCSEAVDLVGALDVFQATNLILKTTSGRGPAYTVEVVSGEPGVICTWSGLQLTGDRTYERVDGPIDTLIVGPFDDLDLPRRDRQLVAWVRRTVKRSRRVASFCSGAFLLAEAGLLDGRRATTHWTFCAELAGRYPRVTVDPEPIYVRDRDVYTSAGSTASMDLVLGLVDEDFGRRVAHAVALRLVLFLKRPAGQAQMSVQLSTQLAERQPLRDLQAWIADHPGEDLDVPALARRVAMIPRNFFRVFTREVGVTPARFVERARVEAARRLLEETGRGVEDIAARCGFGGAETMRGAFQRVLRVSPQSYRARFAGTVNGDREVRPLVRTGSKGLSPMPRRRTP